MAPKKSSRTSSATGDNTARSIAGGGGKNAAGGKPEASSLAEKAMGAVAQVAATGTGGALGRLPMPSAKGTLVYYYIGAKPDDFGLLAYTDPAKVFDLRECHRTIVVEVAVVVNGGGETVANEDVTLTFLNAYSNQISLPVYPLGETRIYYWDHKEQPQTALHLDSTAPIKTITVSKADLNFTAKGYYTLRFYANCMLRNEYLLGYTFDPLVIIVPKRP